MLKCSHSGIILVFFARMVVQMRSSERLELILSEVDRKGFVTVKELSSLCQVNAITIRRDLKWLEENKRIRRTHGGAASLGAHGPAAQSGGAAERHAPRDVAFDSPRHAKRAGGSLSERIDVLIASSPTAKYETVLPDATYKKPVPVVAESTPLETGGGMLTALPLLGEAPCLVVTGDIWTDFDFSLLPREPAGEAHLLLVDNPPQHPRGDYHLDAHGVLHDDRDAPCLTYAGIGVYRPSILQGWRAVIGDAPGSERTPPRFSVVPLQKHFMAQGRMTGQHYRGRWTDVGTPQRLQALEEALSS